MICTAIKVSIFQTDRQLMEGLQDKINFKLNWTLKDWIIGLWRLVQTKITIIHIGWIALKFMCRHSCFQHEESHWCWWSPDISSVANTRLIFVVQIEMTAVNFTINFKAPSDDPLPGVFLLKVSWKLLFGCLWHLMNCNKVDLLTFHLMS